MAAQFRAFSLIFLVIKQRASLFGSKIQNLCSAINDVSKPYASPNPFCNPNCLLLSSSSPLFSPHLTFSPSSPLPPSLPSLHTISRFLPLSSQHHFGFFGRTPQHRLILNVISGWSLFATRCLTFLALLLMKFIHFPLVCVFILQPYCINSNASWRFLSNFIFMPACANMFSISLRFAFQS